MNLNNLNFEFVTLFERYIENRSKTFVQESAYVKRIYLDINFWILLRDGGSSGSLKNQVSAKLKALYEKGGYHFAISEASIWEVLKQSDHQSRTATLQLMEKYCHNRAILGDRQRVRIEFREWINATKKKQPYYPENLIWTSIPLVLNYPAYEQDAAALPENLALSLLDFGSNIPLSKITLPADFQTFSFKDNVENFNRDKELYKHENKTFRSMFLSEVYGCLLCYDDIFIEEGCLADTNRLPTDEEKNEDLRKWCNLIYAIFQKSGFSRAFSTFHISASLFGMFRWNKDRKYKDGNDTMDVMHAAAALPYCDYFFTERELHTSITQLKLDENYDCIVQSDLGKVLSTLENLIDF